MTMETTLTLFLTVLFSAELTNNLLNEQSLDFYHKQTVLFDFLGNYKDVNFFWLMSCFLTFVELNVLCLSRKFPQSVAVLLTSIILIILLLCRPVDLTAPGFDSFYK